MHFNTNEIFNGTFKRKTLERVLKFGKVPTETIKRIMTIVQDVPQDEDEVSIAHVIITLASTPLLETRKAWIVKDLDLQENIAVGLSETYEEAEQAMQSYGNSSFSVEPITYEQFNQVVRDNKGIKTFGLGR